MEGWGGRGGKSQPPKKKTQFRAVTLRREGREGGLRLREKRRRKKKRISACPALLRQQEQTANPVDFFFPLHFFGVSFPVQGLPLRRKTTNRTQRLNTQKSKTNNEQSC